MGALGGPKRWGAPERQVLACLRGGLGPWACQALGSAGRANTLHSFCLILASTKKDGSSIYVRRHYTRQNMNQDRQTNMAMASTNS